MISATRWVKFGTFLTILTLVLARNSKFFYFFVFCGSKSHTSKLLFGLENRLKTKVLASVKIITKCDESNIEYLKKSEEGFDIFGLRNRFLEKFYIDYVFLTIFFYRSKPLVTNVSKIFVRKNGKER